MDPSKLNLEALTVEELSTLKQRMEEDLRVFLQTTSNFMGLKKKYEASKVLVENLVKKKDGVPEEVLIPLSNSLYIPGQILNKDKYIVDIGTGYYAERNGEQAIKYCIETMEVIDSNLNSVSQEIKKKRDFLDTVNIALQNKVLKSRGLA